MHRSRLKLTLLAAPLALALGAFVHADQVVYFSNGKAIMVKSVEKGEKFTVLEMEGGGRIGVPTDQIARIEEYAISAPSAPPQAAPPPAPAPVAARVPAPQPAVNASGGSIGIPANLPPAAPMTPGPGVGGRPTTAPGKGISGLRPLDISGGAAPMPGLQRPVPQTNAGPAMGGPGGASGRGAARPNFNEGRRFTGRPGMAGRGVRPPEANRYVPPPAPSPVQSQPPAPNPPAPAEEDPPTAPEPETEPEPPTDPDHESPEPESPTPEEGETPDDSSGGES